MNTANFPLSYCLLFTANDPQHDYQQAFAPVQARERADSGLPDNQAKRVNEEEGPIQLSVSDSTDTNTRGAMLPSSSQVGRL